MALAMDGVLSLSQHGTAAQHLWDFGCGCACGSVKAHAEGRRHGACVNPMLAQFWIPPLLLQACKAADDLKANLEEEYVAVRTFIMEFCKCMDHIQHAKMLVSGCELPGRLPLHLKLPAPHSCCDEALAIPAQRGTWLTCGPPPSRLTCKARLSRRPSLCCWKLMKHCTDILVRQLVEQTRARDFGHMCITLPLPCRPMDP